MILNVFRHRVDKSDAKAMPRRIEKVQKHIFEIKRAILSSEMIYRDIKA